MNLGERAQVDGHLLLYSSYRPSSLTISISIVR